MPGYRRAAHTHRKCPVRHWNAQIFVKESVPQPLEHGEQNRPREQLETFQLKDGELFWCLCFNSAKICGAFGKGRIRGAPQRAESGKLKGQFPGWIRISVRQRVSDKPEVTRYSSDEAPYNQVRPRARCRNMR